MGITINNLILLALNYINCMKIILTLMVTFISFISYSCIAQKKINSTKDSVSLTHYLKKIKKEVLTKETIEKNKASEPLKTLTIIYGEQIILTTAKND